MKKAFYIAGLIIFIFIFYNISITNKEYNAIIVTSNVKSKYLHFSLDDVQKTCKNLSVYNKETIFADSTLYLLKQMHDKYEIVVSLYIQGDFTINSRYAQELINNSHWLRWGYHGYTDKACKTDMYSFYEQIIDSIGSSAVIDKSPRIHYFHANHATCMKLKELGCCSFLTCDDWSWNSKKRESNYYLSSSQNDILDKNDRLYDIDNKIYFIKTDFRLEHISQRWRTVDNLLAYYATNNSENKELIIFSHEWCFKTYLSELDSIFNWASKNGYTFDFPADRTTMYNNTDILK